jgi:methylmalonyl-CoA mutase cobalamin-binding subunit
MICLSYFELGNSAAHLRHSIRRIRRQIPGAKVLAGLWGHERTWVVDEELRASAGADAYVFSLRQAVRQCVKAASSGALDADPIGMTKAGPSAA